MHKKSSVVLFFSLICFIFFSCSSGEHIQSDYKIIKSAYRIIYFIQGDGSYLYHDSSGKKIISDEKILAEAKNISEKLYDAEVYIFHQKPKRNFLFFFPKDNLDFYFYKNGKALFKEDYLIANEPEAANLAFNNVLKYTSGPQRESKQNLFLYYGHNIPEDTLDNEIFTINKLANFIRKSGLKYALIVLSTCKNGTVNTLQVLSPYTDYIVASPENLHLSQMTSKGLLQLNKQERFDAQKFSINFAKTAFEELKEKTQTIITISIYNTKKLTTLFNNPDFVDTDGTPPEGIITFYNPPKFGKDRNKYFHSGIRSK